jgi:hypothetical protein
VRHIVRDAREVNLAGVCNGNVISRRSYYAANRLDGTSGWGFKYTIPPRPPSPPNTMAPPTNWNNGERGSGPGYGPT